MSCIVLSSGDIKMKLILSIVFTLFVTCAVGEVIKYTECEDVGKKNYFKKLTFKFN